ncbi:Abhydrolase-3 domain-containing protein [Mycena sanguinolenta]|uniref:Abhydrolase-3 domain-containing protein n=1 Tax=Mycena sanguinolenta TaxID=230812 RepID=A0A8H7CUT7_9AGAR|nr:Abhydrolase-3 domain-containing protein [Mycena sanguinolenta]
MNSLTTQAGLKIGPIVLETLVKHYFERLKHKAHAADSDNPGTQLRREELLYDQAFNIVKPAIIPLKKFKVDYFLQSNLSPFNDGLAFSNTRTPSPPWVHVVRLVVPMTCCDDAAQYLITALGGEEIARKLVGGCKWWQVRGLSGVDAQWITAKKDWQEAKRRYKMQDKSKTSTQVPAVDPEADSGTYEEHMDEMRCILYSHGGGYYFGSIDQACIFPENKWARLRHKLSTVSAIPFPLRVAGYPCCLPPPDASHRPVNPAHIVVAGDSAGGGLTLALLQVLRDTGLPLPAGGVLISPWCDLTHSFPSIHLNTDTDVIPEYGLSFQKPSSLWPPPPDEMSRKVHASLRTWIRNTFKDSPRPSTPPPGPATAAASITTLDVPEAPISPSRKSVDSVDVGATAPLPRDSEIITFTSKSGEELRIDRQIHLYTQNSLLVHPLISGALSYLGGLPPLLIIASDKEVLRDEIIYTAHKAANPEKYPIRDDIRAMYPPLDGIEEKFGPTKVHLQVYDDTAHVLPVLFSFTTPGKFCYRAIAAFSRHVTGMRQPPPRRGTSTPRADKVDDLSQLPPLPPSPFDPAHEANREDGTPTNDGTLHIPKQNGMRRAASVIALKRLPVFRSSTLPPPNKENTTLKNHEPELSKSPSEASNGSGSYFSYFGSSRTDGTPPSMMSSTRDSTTSDVAGPRFPLSRGSTPQPGAEREAGDPAVYSTAEWVGGDNIMVRERVSTRGALRPLEPEADLTAFSIPPEHIGVVTELAARRFLDGTQRWDRKFASAAKTVEKHRQRNLERAKKDTVRNMNVLHNFIGREAEAKEKEKTKSDKTVNGIKDGLLASSGSWSWAWALDANENPPPSSIVSRRDTQEALRLARIADQPMLHSEQHSMTANNLWSVIINFLTVTPDKGKYKTSEDGGAVVQEKTISRRKSTFSRFFPPKEKDNQSKEKPAENPEET